MILLISILYFIPNLAMLLFILFMYDKVQPDKHEINLLLTIDIFMRILLSKIMLKKIFINIIYWDLY